MVRAPAGASAPWQISEKMLGAQPLAVTHFLNVDMEIYQDLQPLAGRLGRKVLVLTAGRARRKTTPSNWRATPRPSTPPLSGLCRLIEALPAAEKALWDTAAPGVSASAFKQAGA